MKMWGPFQRDSFREIIYKVKFKYDDGDYSLAIDLMSRDCINVYELITDRLLVDFLSKKLLKLR
ncbi:CDN_1a_G0016630.mRNA.1.CDS.1 [Saccharomyces cerevisiae]|nr:hypothetical protein H760_YJM456F00019 [Saccharomyces cerevisiae YJM456]AJV22507.1 hypothetical protein H800_YJM1342F00015 [Saccharomyces cerevisiae YJM1342]CAI4407631.1 ABH_G0018100.mRNA.1.CDS.1 [Saccharomyces cerevisiae]CAI4447745.1 CDN_1a_G0016630.mRNA.1.CDS.1 [Saccharomyces cerevisiae]CAI6615843.1 ABH_G0018100.mRNA.1.CDS.1 [Saccharomyces cerevisiae]